VRNNKCCWILQWARGTRSCSLIHSLSLSSNLVPRTPVLDHVWSRMQLSVIVCYHMVVLSTAQRYGDLRLSRGSTSSSTYSSGRLEIFINGVWGTVCDDSFGYTDASVACQQLGYSGASRSPVTARYNSLW